MPFLSSVSSIGKADLAQSQPVRLPRGRAESSYTSASCWMQFLETVHDFPMYYKAFINGKSLEWIVDDGD